MSYLRGETRRTSSSKENNLNSSVAHVKISEITARPVYISTPEKVKPVKLKD